MGTKIKEAALLDLEQAFHVLPRKQQGLRRLLREGHPLLPDIPALEPRLQPAGLRAGAPVRPDLSPGMNDIGEDGLSALLPFFSYPIQRICPPPT